MDCPSTPKHAVSVDGSNFQERVNKILCVWYKIENVSDVVDNSVKDPDFKLPNNREESDSGTSNSGVKTECWHWTSGLDHDVEMVEEGLELP